MPTLNLLLLLPLLPLYVYARTITVRNSCSSTIWPALLTPETGNPIPSQATGWELAAGAETKFEVADNWTAGRVWARTGCMVQDGRFQCLTGQCGIPAGAADDSVLCFAGGEPPASLAEFTLAPEGLDHYDISLVDGFNVPVIITPSDAECPAPDCAVNINALCPAILRTGLDQNGVNLGCIDSCKKGFGQETVGNRACCSGGYNDPDLCAICGIDYYNVFKDNCPNAYAYAYDEKSGTALWTCPSSSRADYLIDFCPGGSDYVGVKDAPTTYDNDRATCSGMLTSFPETFPVAPSPTAVAEIGHIKYTAVPRAGGAGGSNNGGNTVPVPAPTASPRPSVSPVADPVPQPPVDSSAPVPSSPPILDDGACGRRGGRRHRGRSGTGEGRWVWQEA